MQKNFFDRIVALIQLDEHRAPEVTGMLYDTLKLACREALSNNRELFGNLFSQVDYLSRKYSMHLRDVVAIQKMRSETRTGIQFSSKELLSHARALVDIHFNHLSKQPFPPASIICSHGFITYRKPNEKSTIAE